MALFLPAGEAGKCLPMGYWWERDLLATRAAEDVKKASSITEVLVCSALEVPTMWGKLGFLRELHHEYVEGRDS